MGFQLFFIFFKLRCYTTVLICGTYLLLRVKYSCTLCIHYVCIRCSSLTEALLYFSINYFYSYFRLGDFKLFSIFFQCICKTLNLDWMRLSCLTFTYRLGSAVENVYFLMLHALFKWSYHFRNISWTLKCCLKSWTLFYFMTR